MNERFTCITCGEDFGTEDETWLHRRDNWGHRIDITRARKQELIDHYRRLETKAKGTGQWGAEGLFRSKREVLEKELQRK